MSVELEAPLRVISLHDLLYCERLFYFTEVEGIQNPTALIYAGRRLHDDVVPLDDEAPERRSLEVASESWGLLGKVDAVRRRDGRWVAYEHKRGRCHRGPKKEVLAWPSDRIQAVAYAVLLEEALGEPVPEARVRYHADNVTAFVEIDEAARDDLRRAIERARELRQTVARPPVTENENLCVRCSLAPVCLPEEERLAAEERHDEDDDAVIDGSRPHPGPHPAERHGTREAQVPGLVEFRANGDVQLCAQALCLEGMLGVGVRRAPVSSRGDGTRSSSTRLFANASRPPRGDCTSYLCWAKDGALQEGHSKTPSRLKKGVRHRLPGGRIRSAFGRAHQPCSSYKRPCKHTYTFRSPAKRKPGASQGRIRASRACFASRRFWHAPCFRIRSNRKVAKTSKGV